MNLVKILATTMTLSSGDSRSSKQAVSFVVGGVGGRHSFAVLGYSLWSLWNTPGHDYGQILWGTLPVSGTLNIGLKLF